MPGGELLPEAVSASLSSARRGPSRRGTRQCVPLCVALCLCGSLAWTTAGLAQVDREQTGGKEDKRIVRISGEVRDAAHRPVAEATVWLAESDARAARLRERVAETRSGADGAFSFFRPVEKETTLSLIARDAKGRLGWNASYIRPGLNTIRLYDVRDVRGRIVDGDGRPIAGARVAPQGFVNLPAGQRASADWTELFAELAPAFETRTAADGGFVLSKIPEQAHVRCEVSAPGFGKPTAVFAAKDAVTIKLWRTGGLSGSLGPLDGVDADQGGYKLRVTRQNPEAETAAEEGVELSYAAELTTGADGAFQGGDLPPGRYEISAVAGQGRPFIASPKIYVEVKPHETTQGVSVPLAPTARVTGRVIDRETRQGIAGVEVLAYQPNDRGRPRESRQVTTGDDGRFEVRLPPSAVFVRVMSAPREFLAPEFDYQNPQPRPIADGEEWPTFELSRAAEVEGVVLDDAGQPAPHAELFLDGISRASVSPFDWLPDRTDGNGRFVIGQLDPELKFSLRARTPDAMTEEMATVAPSDLKGPVRLRVSKENVFRVRGKVVDAAGQPVMLATLSLQWTREVLAERPAQRLRARGPGRDDAGRGAAARGAAGPGAGAPGGAAFPQFAGVVQRSSQLEQLAADDRGDFESGALWPGDTYIASVSAPGFADLQTASIQGTPGGVHDFGNLVLRRNDLIVSGIVVDEHGRAVPNAEVEFVSPPGPAKPNLRSDAEGRFSIMDVDSAIALPLRARTADAATSGATIVLPGDFDKPVKLAVSAQNAFRIRGKAVDRQGKPAAGASVSVVWRHRGPDERTQFALSDGRRIRGLAPLTINQVVPGADGAFETPALWPDENFQLVISAPGYAPAESAIVYGPAGEITAIEPLVLLRNDLKLAGRAVDAAGRPLEGVTVLNSGDADKRLIATTAADGRFALEGLYDGPVHLLARLPGYRAAGWRGAAGGEAIELILPPSDQPPRSVAIAEVDEQARFAAERDLARRLLTALWAMRDRFDDNPRMPFTPNARGRGFGGRGGFGPQSPTITRLAEQMARLDLAQALSWSVSQGGRLDDTVRRAAVAGNLDVDVELAAQLVSGERGIAARNALVNRARLELAAGRQDRALRLLEAAMAVVERDIAANPPAREFELASAGAQIGVLAIRAGDRPWGGKLILQAAAAAEKFAPHPQTEMSRGRAAAALAAIDPAKALQWLRDMQAPEGGAPGGAGVAANLASGYIYTGRAAAVAAASDLDRAREMLKLIGPGLNADRSRLLVVYELATNDPAAAVRMIDEISEPNLWIKTNALCWVAVALAERDPPQASALIDRALELYLDAPPTYPGIVAGGRPAEAARIALAARAIGYADLPGVVDRVLALRLTAADAPSPAKQVESTINAARVLGLVDRKTAHELLISVEPHARLIGDDDSAGPGARPVTGFGGRLNASPAGGTVGRGEWLQAWALADLDETRRRCDEELARLKQQAKIETASIDLLPVIDLLIVGPGQRERFMLRSIDPSFWFPGDDEP